MFDPKNTPPEPAATSTAGADAGSAPAGRVMRIAPLDLRQPRFKPAFRGFDKTEVVAHEEPQPSDRVSGDDRYEVAGSTAVGDEQPGCRPALLCRSARRGIPRRIRSEERAFDDHRNAGTVVQSTDLRRGGEARPCHDHGTRSGSRDRVRRPRRVTARSR